MHIVVVTLLARTGPTGVQSHFNALAKLATGRADVAVEVVTPFDRRALIVALVACRRAIERWLPAVAVQLYRRGHAAALTLALRSRLRALPRAARVLVYAQCPVSADVALRVVGGTGGVVVLAVHFNGSQADEWAEKGRLTRGGPLFVSIRALERRVLQEVDGLVFVSQWMRRHVERIHGSLALPDTIAVIPNFVEPLVPDPSIGAAPDWDLISVGTLEPRKNQALLIDAVALAHARGLNWSLAFVGDGPDEERLRARACMAGVADRVHFLGRRDDVRLLLPRARLYAHAATAENLPLAMIEAMAAALPIVAVRTGGVPELVEDGVTGSLIEAPEAHAMHLAIDSLLQSPWRRARLGAEARRRFESQFSTAQAGERLLTFLQGAAASARAQSPRRLRTVRPSECGTARSSGLNG